MTATAAGFASPSLYVPGIALILLAAGAVGWVLGAASGASLERRVGPGTVQEEHEWPIEITASTGMVPAPGGELVEPLVRGSLPMAGRSSRRMRVAVTFERRGMRRLAPARLVIADPLGLIERQVEAGAGQEVIVLPRIEPVIAAGGGAGAAADAVVGARPAEVAAEVEMESLRPYREGAPASRIHWPTVARVGTLMERRLLADSDSQPLVVLDPTHPADEAALDMAVRAAASLCLHLARAGGCSLLLPGDRQGGGHRRRPRKLAVAARSPCPGRARRGRPGGAARVAPRRDLLGHGACRPAACARTAERRALHRQPGAVARRRRVHGRRMRRGCARPRTAEGGMRAPRTLALELATFAALAWYTAAHWTSGLVAHDPDTRVLACVLIAVAVGPRGRAHRGTAGSARGGAARRVRSRGPGCGLRRDRARPVAARPGALGRARRRPRSRLRRARVGAVALRRDRAVGDDHAAACRAARAVNRCRARVLAGQGAAPVRARPARRPLRDGRGRASVRRRARKGNRPARADRGVAVAAAHARARLADGCRRRRGRPRRRAWRRSPRRRDTRTATR